MVAAGQTNHPELYNQQKDIKVNSLLNRKCVVHFAGLSEDSSCSALNQLLSSQLLLTETSERTATEDQCFSKSC